MPVVKIDFTDSDRAREALDFILGPPGDGAFAACMGDPTDNAPRAAMFYPNTGLGRERYLQHSAEWEAQGRNNFLNSVVWHEDALKLKRAPLVLGDEIRPLRFPVLWVDIDTGLNDLTRSLLEELRGHGMMLSRSGGIRADGTHKVHVRLALETPITDVDEFYRMNRWFARAMDADSKFSPVAWLTLPGSTRFKAEYPDGKAVTRLSISRNRKPWKLRDLRIKFRVNTPEPTGPVQHDMTELSVVAVEGALPVKIRGMLRQKTVGDRSTEAYKLIRLCAEAGYSKEQALWIIAKHAPSYEKYGDALAAQVVRCWPETVADVEELAQFEEIDTLSDIVDGEWLDAQVFPEVQWVVPGLIPEGLGMLVAAPKVGKSFLIMEIGLACAAGGVALGTEPVEQRPVLYLALEDGHRRLQKRARGLMEGARIPKDIQFMVACDPADIIKTVTDYLMINGARKPLIVIDTLEIARPPETVGASQNAYKQDTAYMRGFKRVVDGVPGACIVMVHHTKKGAEADFLQQSSGSNGLTGACDFVMWLHRERKKKEGTLSVTGREAEENGFALVFDNGRWTADGTSLSQAAAHADVEPLSVRQQEALEFLMAQGAEGATPSQIAAAMTTSAGAVSTHLKRLVVLGKVVKLARGLYRIDSAQ